MIPAVYYAGVASARAGYHTEAKEEVTEMKVGTGSNVASPGGKTPTMTEGKGVQTGVKQVINKYRMVSSLTPSKNCGDSNRLGSGSSKS